MLFHESADMVALRQQGQEVFLFSNEELGSVPGSLSGNGVSNLVACSSRRRWSIGG